MYCHKEVHEMHFPEMPDRIDREYMNQTITEYMADTDAEGFSKNQ